MGIRLQLLLVAVILTACVFTNGSVVRSLYQPPVERIGVEFDAGLYRRGIQNHFAAYKNHVLEKLRVTDHSRLPYIITVLRDPLASIRSAEAFTRQLYESIRSNDISWTLRQISEKLDVTLTPDRHNAPFRSDPLRTVVLQLEKTQRAMRMSFQRLSSKEQQELRSMLYTQTTGDVTLGFRFGDVSGGRRLMELLERIDRTQLMQAVRDLTALTDPVLLRNLRTAKPQETSAGNCMIVIAGSGDDEHHLEDGNTCGVIDLGGNDTYIEGTTSAERPVLVILDLGGKDTYRGQKAGIQGSAIMGASVLVDVAGDDVYIGSDVCQGSALAGAGVLIDYQGNDSYRGDRRAQGQAIVGIGVLIDRRGRDRFHAALLSQGVGGPLGFGMLMDVEGDDQYFAGGKYVDSYEDTPGFGSFSQGIGAGAREVAAGGIGVLLDGTGNDVYEADYFSHGGGYWYGAGFARDFTGDDRRIGATRRNFDGSVRAEPRFLRWSVGFGCHYGAGFVFDDDGDDSYHGEWASIAYGWDYGFGALCDFHGDDHYQSERSGVAQAHHSGLAFLYELRGNDSYMGQLGEAQPNSFAFLFDEKGKDQYNRGLRNHFETHRGWAGGFLIDR